MLLPQELLLMLSKRMRVEPALDVYRTFEAPQEPIAEVTAKGTKILWHCVDATSYDRNPYNDNKCTSSTGEVRYLSDYQAEALDTTYRAGKAGAYYYNNK